MKNLSVLVVSCDGYSDVWPVCFSLLFKHWPDCPYDLYLSSNQKIFSHPKVKPIPVGEDLGWTANLKKALGKIADDYVLIILEDLLIWQKINTDRIRFLFEQLIRFDGHCLKLRPMPKPDKPVKGSNDIGEISPGRQYRFSTQIAIWKKATLAELLSEDENIWETEIEASKRSNRYPSGFYSTLNQEIIFTNGLEKGEWMRRNLLLARQEGVVLPTQRHRVMPLRKHFLMWFKSEFRSSLASCFRRKLGYRFNNSIVFVSPFAYSLLSANKPGPSGGAERQFFLFGRGLQECGWRVTFITSKPERPAQDKVKMPVHFASFSYLGGPKRRILFDWLSFWSALIRADAEYYVVKVPEHLLVPLSIFCKIYRRKLVFWGQMTGNSSAKGKNILAKCAVLLERWGIKRADIIIAQTEEQKEYLNDNFGVQATVVPSIWDNLGEGPSFGLNPADSEKAVDILWVGNSMPKKRQEVFFELAKLMPQRTFAMAINNSDRVRFERAREAAGKLNNVLFLGSLPSFEMEAWFGKIKLLVNTSAREGFPNTFLQAWANGVPVVSLNIDPDSIISRYSLGRIADAAEISAQFSETDEQMARRLMPGVEELLSDNGLYRSLSDKARKYLAENHIPNVVIPQLLNILR